MDHIARATGTSLESVRPEASYRIDFKIRFQFYIYRGTPIKKSDIKMALVKFKLLNNYSKINIFFFSTRAEKEDWLEALFQTIKELYQVTIL
jgi:hypothetical protein